MAIERLEVATTLAASCSFQTNNTRTLGHARDGLNSNSNSSSSSGGPKRQIMAFKKVELVNRRLMAPLVSSPLVFVVVVVVVVATTICLWCCPFTKPTKLATNPIHEFIRRTVSLCCPERLEANLATTTSRLIIVVVVVLSNDGQLMAK